MKKLIGMLNSHKELDGYKIAEKKTDSYELFFVHEKLETARATSTTDTGVTVYVDHDGKKGDSSFSLYASMSDEEIEKKIAQAAARAKLISNEPYELPEGGELRTELPENLSEYDDKELAAKIAKTVFTSPCPAGCTINALEIFLYTDAFRVINSKGVDKTQVTRRVMIEAIPTFTDENESVELYQNCSFTIFDEEKLREEISRKLCEVRDRRLAVKPGKELKVRVVLRPEEISELMEELSYDLGYASVYTESNLHKIGDDLQPGACDKLTLTRRAVTPGSEESGLFDADGTELTDTVLIKDGVVENYFGSSRFGQYLKVEKPTGVLNCMKVEPGTLTEEELKREPYIECASMSGMQVDLYNDYIGGEIRLAYYFDGEKTVPVSGVSMSGKLSEALAALRLSNQTITYRNYEGPDKLLLSDMTVL